jgi:hypothetical protein
VEGVAGGTTARAGAAGARTDFGMGGESTSDVTGRVSTTGVGADILLLL